MGDNSRPPPGKCETSFLQFLETFMPSQLVQQPSAIDLAAMQVLSAPANPIDTMPFMDATWPLLTAGIDLTQASGGNTLFNADLPDPRLGVMPSTSMQFGAFNPFPQLDPFLPFPPPVPNNVPNFSGINHSSDQMDQNALRIFQAMLANGAANFAQLPPEQLARPSTSSAPVPVPEFRPNQAVPGISYSVEDANRSSSICEPVSSTIAGYPENSASSSHPPPVVARPVVSGIAASRLAEERKAWRRNHPHGFIAKPAKNDDGTLDLFVWLCFIPGKVGTDWEGGLYPLVIVFPPDFPSVPPTAKFAPSIFHVNVFAHGYVCLSILKEDSWLPSTSITQLLKGIQDLLDEPNASDPANRDAYAVFQRSKEEYSNRIKAQAVRFNRERVLQCLER